MWRLQVIRIEKSGRDVTIINIGGVLNYIDLLRSKNIDEGYQNEAGNKKFIDKPPWTIKNCLNLSLNLIIFLMLFGSLIILD